ncbi:hypothetical protein PsAD46_03683 [Pseudovibrio sp. Ad46]|nr:hypothetical protein PsAD46_03683 [Pseudovibrio sp. Ad46]KZL01808.1 hypothetical protein PsAD5_00378 [Pseudovibrio sp. Ad5]KZL19179.1 hypothetical protein PsWM33_04776 [Pseudovibrio sp. WM33]
MKTRKPCSCEWGFFVGGLGLCRRHPRYAQSSSLSACEGFEGVLFGVALLVVVLAVSLVMS